MAVIKAKRKNTITVEQCKIILKEMLPHVNSHVNHISRDSVKAAVYLDGSGIVHVFTGDSINNSNANLLQLFAPSYFAHQTKGMAIAVANSKVWTNAKLSEDFTQGIKKELAGKLIKPIN